MYTPTAFVTSANKYVVIVSKAEVHDLGLDLYFLDYTWVKRSFVYLRCKQQYGKQGYMSAVDDNEYQNINIYFQ